MRKVFYTFPLIYFVLLILCISNMTNVAFAQEDPAPSDSLEGWKIGGLVSMNFSQSSFTNWAAGGDNNIGISLFYKPFANFTKGKINWENNLDLRYGKNKIGSESWRKSDDLIEANSKLGINAKKAWFYSALLNFRSQFDNGYASIEQIELISRFMSPGYLSVVLGMDYKPNDKLSVLLSPFTTRTTFVLDDSLSSTGSYGVMPGEKSFTQIGPSVIFTYKDEVYKNVLIDSKMNVLYEYASDPKLVFIWDFILGLKVNKFLTTTLTTGMIYDQNILFNVFDESGNVVGQERRVQFKEVLAIGVTFSY